MRHKDTVKHLGLLFETSRFHDFRDENRNHGLENRSAPVDCDWTSHAIIR